MRAFTLELIAGVALLRALLPTVVCTLTTLTN